MTFEQIVSLVAAIGSIASGLSIFTVFLIYDIEKRDNIDAVERQALRRIKDSLSRIDLMFKTEMLCEMA